MRWKKREEGKRQAKNIHARRRNNKTTEHWSATQMSYCASFYWLNCGLGIGERKKKKPSVRACGQKSHLLPSSSPLFQTPPLLQQHPLFLTLSCALSLSPAPALSIGFGCLAWRDPIKAADSAVQLELSHRIFHADNTLPKYWAPASQRLHQDLPIRSFKSFATLDTRLHRLPRSSIAFSRTHESLRTRKIFVTVRFDVCNWSKSSFFFFFLNSSLLLQFHFCLIRPLDCPIH